MEERNPLPFHVCENQTQTLLLVLVRMSVPIPVRSPEKVSHSGTIGHASVPFRHASAVAVSFPRGVVAWSGLPSACERELLWLTPMGCAISC